MLKMLKVTKLNNYHADIINSWVLNPYHHKHEQLFESLRVARNYAPEIAQQIAYQVILDEDRAFATLYEKIRAFIFKKSYEPLTVIETSIFQCSINLYKQNVEELKVELAVRLNTQPVIDAYQASQQEALTLVDFIFKKIAKNS